jgi:hypothetical protein
VSKWWPPLVLLALMVALWEIVVRATGTPDYLFPTPASVARSLGSDAGLLGSATLVTLREVLLGYLLAVAAGLAVAVVLHVSGALRRALLPLLVLSQTVPTVLLAPILAILLGYGIEPKLVVVAIVCFFPIVVSAVDGLRSARCVAVDLLGRAHRRDLCGGRRCLRRVGGLFVRARLRDPAGAACARNRAHLRRGARPERDRACPLLARLPRRKDPGALACLSSRSCSHSRSPSAERRWRRRSATSA